ncbi:MAG: ribonuclease III family protein [Bacteroidales bacterium]|nr:ribonuclease III family protein [Bacteroidales bacterium]
MPVNTSIYNTAFIHKSASIKKADGNTINNERLEFLGDAILGSVVAEMLFNTYRHQDEGFLTDMRSKIVNREVLNDLAARVGLKKLIRTRVKDGRSKNYKGDALEALIGAIF